MSPARAPKPKSVPPRTRNSLPMASPMAVSSAGSKLAPRAMLTGKQVAVPSPTPRGPSRKSNPGMPSRGITAAGQVRLLCPSVSARMRPSQKFRSPSSMDSFSSGLRAEHSTAAVWARLSPACQRATAVWNSRPVVKARLLPTRCGSTVASHCRNVSSNCNACQSESGEGA